MAAAPAAGRLTVSLVCLSALAVTAGLDWSGRMLAVGHTDSPEDRQLTQLMIAQGEYHPCNATSDCCEAEKNICECVGFTCMCYEEAYWQSASAACVEKAGLDQNCSMSDPDSCRLEHSSCVYVRGYGHMCKCDLQYYPDAGGRSCVRVQSPFFTTTIIVSICILFAAVAIGVVMQIRSNMQRRLYQQHYRRRADLDQLLTAQRLARQRRAAQRRAHPTRRYSEEAEPDEPPPPYVPIFTTRSSGDWGKLPSYQEAVAQQDNVAFEMEDVVLPAAEGQAPGSAATPPEYTGTPPERTETSSERIGASAVRGRSDTFTASAPEPTTEVEASPAERTGTSVEPGAPSSGTGPASAGILPSGAAPATAASQQRPRRRVEGGGSSLPQSGESPLRRTGSV
ncbi:uncharacterized protein LOC122380843 [Amphibalanus amphitrite]|uniref:uncharacterized protein LOC122380843 n=1 Tax=Amphibalanus amphitrite TaxID=1232801 RepID=UPI001C917DD6|nr:uncharacterized protein LOC122380843 [Amphibalanus amphitrite]